MVVKGVVTVVEVMVVGMGSWVVEVMVVGMGSWGWWR